MEMPSLKTNERIIACIKEGNLNHLRDIHRNNPTIAFAKIHSAGMPLVHIAATKSNVAIMDYLIDAVKLDPKALYQGQNLLHTAANHGSIPISKYLIESKSFDKSLPDTQGNYPIDLAKRNRHFELVNYYHPTIINPTVKLAQYSYAAQQLPYLKRLPCLICTEEKKGSEFTQLECDHRYCSDCLKQIVMQVIAAQNSAGLQCPTPTCKKQFAQKEIQSLIPETYLQDKLNHLQFQEWLMQEKKRSGCPTPNCPFIFINERTDQFTMQCPSCDAIYCAKCSTQHSASISCNEAAENKQITTNINEQEKATEKWKAENARPCPQCKIVIEKMDGCNHMTCKKCNHQFCWQCMNPWAQRGHGPFGCSLAQPAPERVVQESQEAFSPLNSHLFFARDPLGFKHLLTAGLEHAQFASRFKQLSCEKQDEWAARVTNKIENSRSQTLLKNHVWLGQLEIVEGHRPDNQDSDSDDDHENNIQTARILQMHLMMRLGMGFLMDHLHHNHHHDENEDTPF